MPKLFAKLAAQSPVNEERKIETRDVRALHRVAKSVNTAFVNNDLEKPVTGSSQTSPIQNPRKAKTDTMQQGRLVPQDPR